MKNFLVILLLFVTMCGAKSQIIVNSPNAYLKLEDPTKYNLDYLILINGLGDNTTLNYTGSGSVTWKYVFSGESLSSTQSSIFPEDGVYYNVEIDGVPRFSVYVIDYSLYMPKYTSLDVVEGDNMCKSLSLELQAAVPPLSYLDKLGATRTLERQFTLEFVDKVWGGEEWTDTICEYIFPSTSSTFNVPAPLCNTTFMYYGDQWADEMGLQMDTLMSDEYRAVAVDARPIGVVAEREYLHELDRTVEGAIQGSGPLVVDFQSRANDVDDIFFEWTYWNVKTPDAYTRYTDKDFRHTFTETGEYRVSLLVSTNIAGCEFTDSLNVKVIESFIDVPNAFSPNGDGINDEFRVAYKSISTYVCIVKNRWGRTVFKSEDPGKGWDGKIGGMDAAMGAYYYLIIATGMDENEEGKPVKYKLSGDINLLR